MLKIHSPNEVISVVNQSIEKLAEDFQHHQSTPGNALINRIVAYTDEHYVDNLTLNFISQTFALHPAYFCKLFKRTMGTTYIDYLTNCRIRRAKELLRQTDLPNYLIAEQTGFQTTEYFSKTFKKKTVFLPRNTDSA